MKSVKTANVQGASLELEKLSPGIPEIMWKGLKSPFARSENISPQFYAKNLSIQGEGTIPFLTKLAAQWGAQGKSYHSVWLEGSLGKKRAHSRGCWPRAQRRFPRGDNKRAGSAGTQNSCPTEEEDWLCSRWREYHTRWPGSRRGKMHPRVLGILCDVNRCRWPSHIIVIVPLKIFSLIKAHDAPFFPKYLLGILQQF